MSHDQAMIEFHEAWRLCGLRTTTFEDFQRIIAWLGFVLAQCPASATHAIEVAIINAERRAFHVARLAP